MSKELKLIKEINHLMLAKYIEIFIVILIIAASIPIWNSFAAKITDLDINVPKEIHLKFHEEVKEKEEKIYIINDYALKKNYKVYLITKPNINLKTKIIINKKEYRLDDFDYEVLNNNLQFTIIENSIVSQTDFYTIIIPKLEKNEYQYVFEETNI